MTILINSYKKGLKSVKELRDRLGLKNATALRVNSGRYPHLVLNWGHSNSDGTAHGREFVNLTEAVATASCKSRTRFVIANLQPPTWDLTNRNLRAKRANISDYRNLPVIVRTNTKGSGGVGTMYFDTAGSIPDDVLEEVKLISRYIPKTAEYRVHVFDGEVIYTQQKKRKVGDTPEDDQTKIRSYSNGWIFCTENVVAPPSTKLIALDAVRRLGLVFGAVDVVYNKYYGSFVTEVNTAPGIEGTTADKYAEAITKYYTKLGIL